MFVTQNNVTKSNRMINGRTFCFRSNFEYYWAYSLYLLKRSKIIKEWDYEPRKFKFYGDDIADSKLKGKELGVRVYTPDFKVIQKDDTVEWEETKGYLDNKSYTKLKCFRLYYPDEKITLVMQRWPSRKSTKGRLTWIQLGKLEQMGVRVRCGDEIEKQMKGLLKR
jgi:hypothetical protein